MNSIQRFSSRLGRLEIWSWQLAAMTAGLFAVLTFLFDCLLLNNWSLLWLPIAIVSYLESIVLVAGFKILIRRFMVEKPRAWLNLSIAAVVGALHNLTVALFADMAGFLPDALWSWRVVGGAMLGSFWVLFYGISYGQRIEHKALMSRLSQTNQRLSTIRATSVQRLNQERRDIAEFTRQALVPKLEQLQALIAQRNSRLASIETFRQTLLNDVRPISADLQNRAVALESWTDLQPPLPARKVYLGSKLPMRELIAPLSSMLLGVLVVWGVAYIVMGQPEAGNVLVASITIFPILWLARKCFPRGYQPSAVMASMWLVILGVVCSAVPLAIAFYLTNPGNQNELLFVIPVFTSLLLLSIAEAISLDVYRLEVRERLDKANQAIQHELALFDQKIWLSRRSWQFVVHGSVQAALTAALTRLLDPALEDAQVMALVNTDIDRALNALQNVAPATVNLNDSVAELRATWDGVCSIVFNSTDRAVHALVGNSDTPIFVNEIMKESVNNAVRHAKARVIVFDLDARGDQLTLVARNDGQPLEPGGVGGVGSKLLDDLTLSWSLSFDEAAGQTKLTAHLPVR